MSKPEDSFDLTIGKKEAVDAKTTAGDAKPKDQSSPGDTVSQQPTDSSPPEQKPANADVSAKSKPEEPKAEVGSSRRALFEKKPGETAA